MQMSAVTDVPDRCTFHSCLYKKIKIKPIYYIQWTFICLWLACTMNFVASVKKYQIKANEDWD